MANNNLELLAPAGKWEVMEAVAAAGADAVYLGGKRFNMRLVRPGFNFSDQELQDAVNYLHQQGKRIYITVNNLYYDDEIAQLSEYLLFLEEIGVDALIIQDVAIIKLHQQLGLTLPMHASVQMGLDSAEALNFLAENGVSRAILSKNLTLEEIAAIHKASPLTIEFFAHGDLCISHTGQCLLSNLISGNCGNRGVCIKPCRWPYTLDGTTAPNNKPAYYLAHKDLCLYPYLKDLVEAGVSSFKLEGRMQGKEYLTFLVETYRKGLDRIIENREDIEASQQEAAQLFNNRIRDICPGSLLGRTNIQSIGLSGEREPYFKTWTRRLDSLKAEDYKEPARINMKETSSPDLRAKVANYEMLQLLLERGLKSFILGYEYIRQYQSGWNRPAIDKALMQLKEQKIELTIETPRIVNVSMMDEMKELMDWVKELPELKVMVNDYGSLQLALERGIKVSSGPGFNISNSVAFQLLRDQGLERISVSTELDFSKLNVILECGSDIIEMMVHGPLYGLVSDFCPARGVAGIEQEQCPELCLNENYALVDEYGQRYRLLSDAHCRNYVYYPHDLCLLSYLPLLYDRGLRHMRLDLQFYSMSQADTVVTIYQEALAQLEQGNWCQQDNYLRLLQLFPQGLTTVPYFRS